VAVAVLALLVAAWMERAVDVDGRLRAIDTAHVMDEEMNPARGYTDLAWDWRLPSLDERDIPGGAGAGTLEQPWRAADYPQLAEWIEERRGVVEVLRDLGQYETCWFSVYSARWQAGRRHLAAGRWLSLMVRAANLEFGEGRPEAGLEMTVGALRVAGHFREQLSPEDWNVGMRMTDLALRQTASVLVAEEVPEAWLARIEAVLPSTGNAWGEVSKQAGEVRWLYGREHRPPIRRRLRQIWAGRKQAGIRRDSYLLNLARYRVTHLVLGLRRHKSRTGAWPVDLVAIKDIVAPEAFDDPLTGKVFLYRREGAGFVLYSSWPDGVDDGGKPNRDRVFWPL
jgi:hypothetical protein